jgi:hypothetical protein
MTAERYLIIFRDGTKNYFNVRIGDFAAHGLTPDEALWVTSEFLRGRGHGYLKTVNSRRAGPLESEATQ